MKKRICALFAALLLTFCMAGTALAVELPFDTSGDYWLYDPQGLVSQEDTARLEETLDAAGWNHRCGIYILLLRTLRSTGIPTFSSSRRMPMRTPVWGWETTATAFS